MNNDLGILKQLVILSIIPLLWVVIDKPWDVDDPGLLDRIKKSAMDMRFRARGPEPAPDVNLEKPIPVVYVNMDSKAISMIGERPWNRKMYGDVAAALIQLGRAKSVAYDFILSSLAATDMVPLKNIRDSNDAMARVVQAFPDRIVLAGAYTGAMVNEYMDQPSILPMHYRKPNELVEVENDSYGNPTGNPYPEVPTAPIIGPDYGDIGIINVDEIRNAGAVPRWVPLYTRYEGEAHTKNLMNGFMKQFDTLEDPLQIIEEEDTVKLEPLSGIDAEKYPTFPRRSEQTFHTMAIMQILQFWDLRPEDALEITDTEIIVRDGDKELYRWPLIDEQLVEINWFSGWEDEELNPKYSVQLVLDYWTVFKAAVGIDWDPDFRMDLMIENLVPQTAAMFNADVVGSWAQVYGMFEDEEVWTAIFSDPEYAEVKGQIAEQIPELMDIWKDRAKTQAFIEEKYEKALAMPRWLQIREWSQNPEEWKAIFENPERAEEKAMILGLEKGLADYWQDSARVDELTYSKLIFHSIEYAANEESWEAFKLNPSNQRIFRTFDKAAREAAVKEGKKPEEAQLLSQYSAGQAAMAAWMAFEDFRNTVVLVGPTDPILQDLAPTPFSSGEEPKVSVHGNLFKTLSSQLFISHVGPGTQIAAVFILSWLVAFCGLWTGKHSNIAKFFTVLILGGYIWFVFYSFESARMVIPLVAPVGAAFTTTVAGLIWRIIVEEKQKGRIKGMFGTYLSPELVTQMVESGDEPSLGGVDATISAYFSDVQSFSSFSEKLTPEQLVNLMNEYLTAMTDILMDYGCYVDKYIGDAIVGIYNAPVELEDHALKGCIACMHMHKRLEELRVKWRAEGDKWPPIVGNMQARMGMNTGHATVGNMGSEKRFNYTMMGDTVNLAARCESGAKAYGVYTMITGETKEEAEKHGDDCVFRYLDKIVVKGRTQPAEMYEVVCLREDLDDETTECLKIYDDAMKAFLGQKWDEAHDLFKKAATLEPNRKEKNAMAPTTPSDVMAQRALDMKANPPGEDWDGVYIMTSK